MCNYLPVNLLLCILYPVDSFYEARKQCLSPAGTWTPQGQFMQQLPPQLDDLRYHHHPQYTSSAPYHQPPAAPGEGRIIFKMFSSANKHKVLQGVLLSPG
jgi:hypothetical protein